MDYEMFTLDKSKRGAFLLLGANWGMMFVRYNRSEYGIMFTKYALWPYRHTHTTLVTNMSYVCLDFSLHVLQSLSSTPISCGTIGCHLIIHDDQAWTGWSRYTSNAKSLYCYPIDVSNVLYARVCFMHEYVLCTSMFCSKYIFSSCEPIILLVRILVALHLNSALFWVVLLSSTPHLLFLSGRWYTRRELPLVFVVSFCCLVLKGIPVSLPIFHIIVTNQSKYLTFT